MKGICETRLNDTKAQTIHPALIEAVRSGLNTGPKIRAQNPNRFLR